MVLPKLRPELDVTPSPDPANPGVFIRDTYRFTDAWLIVPHALVDCLRLFDGNHTELDLQIEFRSVRSDAEAAATELFSVLDRSGFLDNETYAAMRDAKVRAFAENPVRQPVFAGSGYAADPTELHATIAEYLAFAPAAAAANLCGIAAPHATPSAAQRGYAAAYGTLGPELADRTFIILGTSHYGQPNRFGLTRKPYLTPFGAAQPDARIIDILSREPAAILEDYCHAIEHSIEFQVLFLQHLYGPQVKIVPILCGSFYPSISADQNPEDDERVRSFFEALSEIADREAERVFWILGVDMAHVGRRYGDPFVAVAEQDDMRIVRERDADRITSLTAGDAPSFWSKIKTNRDDLKWCGSSPFYTFLRTIPELAGTMHHYEQWQIDPQSVVSYAGMSFTRR